MHALPHRWCRFAAILTAGCCAAFAAGETLGPGDSRATVVAALGQPDAVVSSSSGDTLYYPRGKVVMEGDVVASVELISEGELREEQARREKAEEYRRQKRLEIGKGIKDAKLADPFFQRAPAWQQVAFWQDFRRNYPEIPVDIEYTVAIQKQALEQASAERNAEQQRRILALEARVREAEAKAREAEARAREAEARARVAENRVRREERAVQVIVQAPSPVVADWNLYPGWGWSYHYPGYSTVRYAPVGRWEIGAGDGDVNLDFDGRPAGLDRGHAYYIHSTHGVPGSQARSVFKPPLLHGNRAVAGMGNFRF